MMMFTFSAFDWKNLFWVNLFQKVKIISLSEIRYLHYFQYTELNSVFHLFHFRSEMSFLGKFGPISQDYQFMLKCGTYTNSNMQNLMVMFNFSAFEWKYLFWENLVQKVKIVSLRSNFVGTHWFG